MRRARLTVVLALLAWIGVYLGSSACSGSSSVVAPPDYQFRIVSGNDQSGQPGTTLPQDLVVEYKDAQGNPAPPTSVAWTSNAGLEFEFGITDAGTGRTTNRWTLSQFLPVGQVITVTATIAGEDPVTFRATTTSAPPPPPPPPALSCASAGGTEVAAPVSANATWTAAGSPYRVRSGSGVTNAAVLTIEPGALICVDPNVFFDFTNDARLVAQGTAAAPVVFTRADPALRWRGLRLVGSPPAASVLDYVTIEFADAGFLAGNADVVSIDHSVIRQSGFIALSLSAPGSQFLRSTVDGTERVVGVIPNPAVGFAMPSNAAGSIRFEGRIRGAAGVALDLGTGTVQLANCEITGSAGNAIELKTNTVVGHTVSGCNIFGNGGFGVANTSTVNTLNAQNNWWGDPAGPSGPDGDGVSGMVDASSPRGSPVALDY